jgi:alginate O-acetyltransferase complex protein AlgI
VAGPIDRSQRWIAESNARKPVLQSDRIEGIWRILRGVFKKFVLADGLALIALNSQNAAQIQSTGWAWLILYAYALRIFFDFSGYTDIAIGLARLAGFHLPENFDRPYF